jgi:hypothetical protein
MVRKPNCPLEVPFYRPLEIEAFQEVAQTSSVSINRFLEAAGNIYGHLLGIAKKKRKSNFKSL